VWDRKITWDYLHVGLNSIIIVFYIAISFMIYVLFGVCLVVNVMLQTVPKLDMSSITLQLQNHSFCINWLLSPRVISLFKIIWYYGYFTLMCPLGHGSLHTDLIMPASLPSGQKTSVSFILNSPVSQEPTFLYPYVTLPFSSNFW